MFQTVFLKSVFSLHIFCYSLIHFFPLKLSLKTADIHSIVPALSYFWKHQFDSIYNLIRLLLTQI